MIRHPPNGGFSPPATTVSRIISADEAERYEGWTANRRRLDETLAEMRAISCQADALVAATAIVEQIPVVTQDDDYDAIPGVQVIRV